VVSPSAIAWRLQVMQTKSMVQRVFMVLCPGVVCR
jgi:hypothetical protein